MQHHLSYQIAQNIRVSQSMLSLIPRYVSFYYTYFLIHTIYAPTLHVLILISTTKGLILHGSTSDPVVNAQWVSLPSLTEMPWWMCLLAVLSCPGSRCVKAMSPSYHWTITAFFRRFFLSTAAYYPCCSSAFRLLLSRGWVGHTCIQSPRSLSFCTQTTSL